MNALESLVLVRIANRAGAALLTMALLTFGFVGVVLQKTASSYLRLNNAMDNIHAIVDTANSALSSLKDAETGQRGFLLATDEQYLEPYNLGLKGYDAAISHLKELTGSDANVQVMAETGELKKAELAEIIRLSRREGLENALVRLRQGAGKAYMDHFRQATAQLIQAEETVRGQNSRELSRLESRTRLEITLGSLALFLFTLAGVYLLGREVRHERRIAASLEASEKEYRELAATLEEQVELRTEDLRHVNSELMAFSYSVSHDLRAPLRSIDGFSQIILEDYADRLDDTGRDLLGRVRASTKRMGELIQSLLELSRVTQLEPVRQHVSISSIAGSVLNGLAAAEPTRQVGVSVAPDLMVQADPQLTRIVLENLLNNAWKFTSRADPAKIEVGRTERNGTREFFVRDNGAGFDGARAERLFTPFHRFHSDKEYEGTGIGLATVQRIIHRHGGSIRAESRKGEGATFFFTI